MTRKRVGLLGIIAALALAGAGEAQSLFTGTEQAQLVTGHNSVRATVDPTAVPPLSSLAWSSTLATGAQAHANACVFAHSGVTGIGENLYASTGNPNLRPAPSTIVGSWAGEKASYDYATNTCAPGQICGHYTQMVVRAATLLGCGIRECSPATTPFQPPFNTFNWYLVVCQYNAPQGGGRPYMCDYDGNGIATNVCSDDIFRDGFESGNRNAWQATTPP